MTQFQKVKKKEESRKNTNLRLQVMKMQIKSRKKVKRSNPKITTRNLVMIVTKKVIIKTNNCSSLKEKEESKEIKDLRSLSL